jgi:hypothetical protein
MINELVKIMQRGKHCPESIQEVKNITSFGDLVKIMYDYKKELGAKHFPTASFVRKHYPHVKDIANMNGFFFGEKKLKIKDIWKTVLMGDCDCEFTLSECRAAHIVVRHKSKVRLVLNDYSKVTLYLSEDATFEVISKTRLSHVNVVRYE